MITSTQNRQIKWVRALQAQRRARLEEQAFVVEGVRLVEEALAAHWGAKIVLCSENLSARGRLITQEYAAQGVRVEQVSTRVMRAASDTQTPQGILAVLQMPSPRLPEAADFVFIPDGVRDPGNLGTMLRTAVAAGVQAVLVPQGNADLYAPKVVRAAMGAHFRLPIHAVPWSQVVRYLEEQGIQPFLADVSAKTLYNKANLKGPLAIIVGGEAYGPGAEAQQLANTRLLIPMPGGSESLNAAVSAGILLFEVVRQRRSA